MKKKLSILLVIFLFLFAGNSYSVPSAPYMSLKTNGTHVNIYWTPILTATGYRLYYAPYPYQGQETIGSVDIGTHISFETDLWAGAAFLVAVQAYDEQGGSNYSNIETIIMGPPSPEWVDNDGDGFHEAGGDCNDSDASVHPGVAEICGDNIDQDCSGADLPCNSNDPLYLAAECENAGGNWLEAYLECENVPFDLCRQLDGTYTSCGSSCRHQQSNLSCVEICVSYCAFNPQESDSDMDGYSESQGDCDDNNFMIKPGAYDVCGDQIDQNCDGSDVPCQEETNYSDNDNDGYTINQGDCNDNDKSIRPGTYDFCGDGIDQDCDGHDEICQQSSSSVDRDGDGFSVNQGDCNDNNASIRPGAYDVCGDGIDQDCSGSDKLCTSSSSASARCKDGTLSYSSNCSGTCSSHGGVAVWYNSCGQ